ncbi:MAG: magnesium-translocating P-type ATPase [Spirochaetaceae bacterium]|nr:magnesium-translocating P-type ATPase [Spirochaetaceae bacterium]
MHFTRKNPHRMPASSPARKQQLEDEKRLVQLCSLSSDEVLSTLNSGPNGLDDAEVEKRRSEFGPNELQRSKHLSFFADIFERLKSPLDLQLLVIALVSLILGEYRSAIIVGVMVLLSVGLSYVLDHRSNEEVEALGKRVQSRVFVLRNGTEREIKISEVVPGDIVLLHSGSIVPADLRLISAKDFFVSESTLTGESMPVEKSTGTAGIAGTPGTVGMVAGAAASASAVSALNLPNACFMGTSVTSGTAKGIVINTGMHTLFGAISEKLTEKREETNFDKGIRSFTLMMIRIMLVMVSLVFFIVGLTKGNWTEALLFSLSVAVGLTPEMLPMIVTTNLAKGALTMAKKKVIVKRLPAIQNLGAINILCTDKTGTLTQDKVVLEHHEDIIGNQSDEVLNYAYLNSYFQTGLRNLLDRAVLEYVDLNVDNCRLVDELPFDFQRRRMSVVVEYEGDNVLICKGAVEEIYSCCSQYQIDEEIYPLIDMIRADLFEEVEKLNREGFRVLGIAYREFPKDKTSFTTADESQLVLLGYIAFMDPPKESVTEAIGLLGDAGVGVKVLTGDNGLVTQKVCQEVGINAEKIIAGSELAALSPADFSQKVKEYNVFVKLAPAQKEQIVKELRSQGNVVGYMGDGINDTMALKAADVGISVDSAVDVAKDSADIVLLEKSLLVLEEGIMEGRRIFANIIKYIRMSASSNFGNMFSMVGASFLFPFLPMQPVQILTNNLLYDFSQSAIPSDNVDPEQIAKPVKWDIGNIKRFMTRIGPISSIFDYATFGLMWFVFGVKGYGNPLLASGQKDALVSLFQTGWFVESLLTQTLIVHIIRTRKIPFFQSRASAPMLLTTLAVMILGIWLPYSPFAASLGFVKLPPLYWVWIAGFMGLYSVITHKVKTWYFRKFEGV